MHQKYFSKTDRLRLMQRSDAIATLRMRRLRESGGRKLPPAISRRREASHSFARAYLCKIGESDFAAQIAARNPQWDLKIVNEKVIYCASFGERVLSPQTWHPQAAVSYA